MDKNELKVEDVLPVKAVGIECLKEANPEKMSPHRKLFKWFARRPTAATRLALLSSLLPRDVSNDELLRLMKIAPRNPEHLEKGISEYVEEKWATKNSRDGTLDEHFGYPVPHSALPSADEFDEFHDLLREQWGGDLPTVLDPTAGGGTIPMESARYGLPTKSNELNPIAWLINKVILEYAGSIGTLKSDVIEWAEKIDEDASQELKEYFPSRGSNQNPSHYFCTYSIDCPSCGYRLPLTSRWWFLKKSSSEGHAIRPHPEEDKIDYEHLKLPEDSEEDSEFDPSEGTVSGGDAECPTCGVVTERSTVVDKLSSGQFEYEVCGVRFETQTNGKSEYRAGTPEDKEAINSAREAIESDLNLATLLNEERYIGVYDRCEHYGIKKWRDVYSPRQLLSHATYLQAFLDYKQQIKKEYDEKRAEAVLVLLSLVGTKLINRNSRLGPIDVSYGTVNGMFGRNSFKLQWQFGETNLSVGTYSYESELNNILQSYEEVSGYFEHEIPDIDINQGDAADLPYDSESVDAVVVDPPYGDNVMYAEFADVFYVWLRQYLGSEFPDVFQLSETNKQNEAVENTALVPSNSSGSKRDVARQRYENKMSDIFNEQYRVLERGGILTVYFTDKETAAWDSLTMSLINSGFTVVATHTITSEMPQRVGTQGNASADSTLLLTCRKPVQGNQQENRDPTLWTDIQSKTRDAARKKAAELLDSNLSLTKTDTIIGAFGPTLRVFTENYPVVDKHDEPVRPKRALEEARTAVVEVLVKRELQESLDDVDSLTTWYILSWLVYERETIPYDDARQLGLGVGVNVDEIKSDTKIWGKSGDKLILKGQSYRVRDYSALESGEKRRQRAYPVDPRENSFSSQIDAVHAAINVIQTKGSDFVWNWLNERGLHEKPQFRRTVTSLLRVLPESFEDYELLVNLVSGDTGELLDINTNEIKKENDEEDTNRTTLNDF